MERKTSMDDSTGTSVCERDYCGLCLLMSSIKSGYPFTRHSYKDRAAAQVSAAGQSREFGLNVSTHGC